MIDFCRVGTNPAMEAPRLKALYADEGIDERITREFGASVEAYTTMSVAEAEERITQKYVDTTEAIGVLAVYDEADIGMAVAGLKEFAVINEPSEVGVNISGWILEQYRGQGHSKSLGVHTLRYALERTENQEFPEWFGAPIWTSIHHENLPSIAAAQRNGFRSIGVAANDANRQIFVF